MLVMFRVKNFASFRDEVTLDMRAASYKQHPTHVVKIDEDISLLKTAAIYGANASGKSNLIRALYFFKRYISGQFVPRGEKNEINRIIDALKVGKSEPFLLSSQIDPVTEFEITFYAHNKLHRYGFSFLNSSIIKEEWYEIDEKKVFTREGTKLSFGNGFRKYISSYKTVAENRLYIPLLDYLLDQESRSVILDGFMAFFEQECLIYDAMYFETSIKEALEFFTNTRLHEDETLRGEVVRHAEIVDLGIAGLEPHEFQTKDPQTGEAEKQYTFRTIHNTYDPSGENVRQIEFPLGFESAGTQHFIRYAEGFISVMERGGVFVVDEISAHLHPMLTKYIVDLFQSDANTKAQLIFTTHDTSLLNREQFRRDEVYFIDKDFKGVSSLYSLSDLKIREDSIFFKDYLQGKYGAIPILRDVMGDEAP